MAAPAACHVNLNWSIDLSAGTVVKLSSGILTTALSDNVQTLAVMVCEAYGARLPMCLETRSKMERLARRKHSLRVLRNVGMTVGFAPNDVAHQLSTTESGVRFLGLAAALLSLGSPFAAAQTLHFLLDESSPNTQILPTVQQVKELLMVLEYKISCSGFVDSLQGWDIILKSAEMGLEDIFIDPDGSTDAYGQPLYNKLPETRAGSLQDTLSSPPRSSAETGLLATFSGPELCLKDITKVRQAKVFGLFRQSGCPPQSAISKMVRAMAELERVGEATSATIQAPADIAVWCIVFIKWCLGVAPSVRRLKRDGTSRDIKLLKQPHSKVTLEIADYGSKNFIVSTFRKLDRFEDLLWESASVISRTSPWVGLLSPKVYFQSRVRNLQTRHNLFHVIDTFLVSAREVTASVKTSRAKNTAGTTWLFPPCDELVELIARLFDIDEATNLLQSLDTSTVLGVWKGRQKLTLEVSILFFEILMLSLVENSRHGNFDDFFVATPETRNYRANSFTERILSWIKAETNSEALLDPILDPSEICLHVLTLLGAHQTCADGSMPLISSKRGQVVYPSLLETLALSSKSPLSYKVFQGRLRYEDQYYAYATGDNQANSANMLWEDPDGSLISSSPVSFEPTPDARSPIDPKGHQWFCTKQDNHLALYFTPYLHGGYSLSPDLFVRACASTIILQSCLPNCRPLGELADEINYCANLAAAFSNESLRLLRVFTCIDYIDTLFIQAALVDIWSDIVDWNGLEKSKTITVAKGQGCLSCACWTALQILKQKFQGQHLERARAMIIA